MANPLGIPCPECGSSSGKVVDSRPRDGGTRRRRICDNGHRFSTVEVVARPDTIITIRTMKDGFVAIGQDGIDAIKRQLIKRITDALGA